MVVSSFDHSLVQVAPLHQAFIINNVGMRRLDLEEFLTCESDRRWEVSEADDLACRGFALAPTRNPAPIADPR